jgi:hypothetical protein
MILLVNGATRTLRRLACPYLGHLLSPRAGNRIEEVLKTGLLWAADNGAFTAFSSPAFLRMVTGLTGKPRCLFVVCPDVVGHARKTLNRFEQWRPVLDSLRLPLALAGQDGLEDCDVPWWALRALFIGGSTKWKLSHAAADLAREAKRRGKWLHMGRVNSKRRVEYAHGLGCDSIDGSKFSWYPDTYLPDFIKLLRRLDEQGCS